MGAWWMVEVLFSGFWGLRENASQALLRLSGGGATPARSCDNRYLECGQCNILRDKECREIKEQEKVKPH